MAVKYIKKAAKTPETDDHKTQAAVQDGEFPGLIQGWEDVKNYFFNNNNKLSVKSLAKLIVFPPTFTLLSVPK